MDYKNLEIKKILPFKISVFFVILILIYIFLGAPITKLRDNSTIIHVNSNDNLSIISKELQDKRIIKSEFFLKSFLFLFKSDRKIKQGDYLFKKNHAVFEVAWQLARNKYGVEPIKITLREGISNEEIANVLKDKLINFDKNLFLEKTFNKEGYLFPDTYFFFPMDTTEEVIEKLSQNFLNQTNKINSLIKNSKRNLEDIIKMASIIEKEASGEEDVYLISGILWKRLSIGMPLQVDAYKYTYENKGLPDKPICNPGILSIKASIKPISSSYLYYLHDKNGEIHFAKNYEEHQENINKYLK